MSAFSALVKYSPDVVSLIDPAGQVLFVSPACTKLLGYLPQEIAGRNTLEMIHPDDLGHSRRALRRALAHPHRPSQTQARVLHQNGEWRWVESTITNLLHEPRVKSILINCREIDADKSAFQTPGQHEALAALRANLDHFAYTMSHDLMEPLRTISMFTELLTANTTIDLKSAQAARFIIEGTHRMASMLEGLRAFALSGAVVAPRRLDLARIAAAATENLGHAIASSGASVTAEELPWVYGNEMELVRVFQNLIANAIKYRSEKPVEIRITAARAGPNWIVLVKDNGIGISEKHHESVFRLLERLNGPEIPGAGIGLAICRKIIESMGGVIWVESISGEGSTFCFRITAADGAGGSTQSDTTAAMLRSPAPNEVILGDDSAH